MLVLIQYFWDRAQESALLINPQGLLMWLVQSSALCMKMMQLTQRQEYYLGRQCWIVSLL